MDTKAAGWREIARGAWRPGLVVVVLAGCQPSAEQPAARQVAQPQPAAPADRRSEPAAPMADAPQRQPARAATPDELPPVADSATQPMPVQPAPPVGEVPRPAERTPGEVQPAVGKPAADAAPLEPVSTYPPVVVLSQGHAATCRVLVGEEFPPATLPDLAGQPHALADLRGEKLTVVLLWSHEHRYAREQFLRLPEEVTQPFGGFGVQAVAIHVGPAGAEAAQLAGPANGAVPSLIDADRALFDQVATEKLPRVYLLDAAGTVLWFDIEYSVSTRRELRNALHHYLSSDSR